MLGKIDLQKDRLTMNFSSKLLNTTVEVETLLLTLRYCPGWLSWFDKCAESVHSLPQCDGVSSYKCTNYLYQLPSVLKGIVIFACLVKSLL